MSPPPGLVLSDLNGRSVALDDLLAADRGALLFFTNPGCAQCDPLLPALGREQEADGGMSVAVITPATRRDNQVKAEEHGLAQVLLQHGFEVAEAYRVFGSPGAVVIDEAGRIASERATGVRLVTELLEAIFPSSLELVAAPTDDAEELAAVSAS